MVSSNAADDDAAVSHPAHARWVVFACAGRRYAFPLEHVSEIVAPRPVTRLPGVGPEVCGLIGVRGRAVTVLDFGAMMGAEPAATRPDHRLLLLELDQRHIGFAVDEMLAIRPAQVEAGGVVAVGTEAVLGTGVAEGEPFVALDPVRLTAALLQA